MVLGDDGIIAQAQQAKTAQEDAEEKDAIQIAIGEAKTSQYGAAMTETEVEEILGDIFDNDDATDKPAYNNSVIEIKEFTKDDGTTQYLPIPKGMSHAFGTIDEGAVVVDSKGNEFVWIKTTGSFSSEVDSTIDEQVNEEKAMIQSVKAYKGFYIGRYETGGFDTNEVVSKPGQKQVSCSNFTWDEMYTMQKALWNKENNNVGMVSGMIYSGQWLQAASAFLGDVENPNLSESGILFKNNPTAMGHFCYESGR